MIYRILVDSRKYVQADEHRQIAIPYDKRDAEDFPPELRMKLNVLVGAGRGGPHTSIMFERGLRVPALENHRVRFYFTERGWKEVGRHVAAKAREIGHVVRVIRMKNPDGSRVIYRDQLQVAVLPFRASRKS